MRESLWNITEVSSEIEKEVAEIIAQLRDIAESERDGALLKLRRRFESELAPEQTLVPPSRIREALDSTEAGLQESLRLAASNIRQVAEAELAGDVSRSLPEGQQITIRSLPVDAAGVYAPGGRAAYPSTVLMCCVPAKVAGVGRIVVTSPVDPKGQPHRSILAAAAIVGADEVHAMGGAHAVAALALGTSSIEAVDVIVGPGNQYVQEAKRQLFGLVGIDSIAGPSEVIVLAEATANVRNVALDLAAQAEHGPDSPVILVGTDSDTLTDIDSAYSEIISVVPGFAGDQLTIVDAVDLDSALAFVDEMAPEHLELHCPDSDRVAMRVGCAGAVFHGEGAGAVFGDYVAGSNHVLPTRRTARFAGPLSANTFRRRQALVSLTAEAAQALAPHAARIARAEGFPIHAESAEARAQEHS
ncbi:MAG: histidinol dehydrogenase [Solirubrobacterales bacterium]